MSVQGRRRIDQRLVAEHLAGPARDFLRKIAFLLPIQGPHRSRYRWSLPVAVLGSSATNSTHRGYLYGAIRDFTNAWISRAVSGVAATSGRRTTKALGFARPSV